MKKGLAIKIASGVLVVALVVVVALAITGVFSGKKTTDPIVANAEDASVSNVAVFRNIATDKVFYIQSSKSITDVSSYVNVRANGKDVSLKISDKKDENGGPSKKETWIRVCLLTENIGAVDVSFRMYEETNLDVRIYFSERENLDEFRDYMDEFRASFDDKPLTLMSVKVGVAGAKT